MAATVVVRWVEEGEVRSAGLESVGELVSAGKPVWVDVTGPEQATMEALAATFGLHPLAVEDVLKDGQRPKIDSYDCGPFIVWIVADEVDGRVRRSELDVFLGKGYVLTCHSTPIEAVDRVAEGAAPHLEKGPEWVLYGIVDHASDHLLPIIDRAADEIDQLEDLVIKRADRTELHRVQLARRRVRMVHRILGPERDVLRALVREEDVVSSEAYRYFQDVGDHLARAEDALDTVREMASDVMNIYLSAVSNNLNLIMKRLTLVTAVFLPGTLVAGIYGMNFHDIPELTWQHGYLYAWVLIIGITGGMLYYFKRSDWW